MKLISIIVPVLNEEKNIPIFLEELEPVVSRLPGYAYEVIIVNDGSTDMTHQVLSQHAQKNPQIKVIHFSRNFGKEIALSAGMHLAKGDAAISMDVDLLHPPELIRELIGNWEKGHDVVIAIRKSHAGEVWWKRAGAFMFYRILDRISDTKMIPYATDFRLVSRRVLEVFKLFQEQNRMTRGLIDWLGFEKSYIYFDSRPREGKPVYTFTKLCRLAINGFIKNSLFPLKLVGYLGVMLTGTSSIVGIIVVSNKYIFHQGWGANFSAVDMVSVGLVFMLGVLLSGMGILALYIADIQTEIRRRPLYVIKDTLNI